LPDAWAELDQKKIIEDYHSKTHKVLRIKEEKDKDTLKEEKKILEVMIADFLNQKEGTREKIKNMREICEK
jgi:hypothetical protein